MRLGFILLSVTVEYDRIDHTTNTARYGSKRNCLSCSSINGNCIIFTIVRSLCKSIRCSVNIDLRGISLILSYVNNNLCYVFINCKGKRSCLARSTKLNARVALCIVCRTVNIAQASKSKSVTTCCVRLGCSKIATVNVSCGAVSTKVELSESLNNCLAADLSATSFAHACVGSVTESLYLGINVGEGAESTGVSGITIGCTCSLGYNGRIVVLVSNNLVKPSVLTLSCGVVHTKNCVNGYFVTIDGLIVHLVITGLAVCGVKTVDADLVALCILDVEVTVSGVVKTCYNTGDVVLLSSVGVVRIKLCDCKSLGNGKYSAVSGKRLFRAGVALEVAVLINVTGCGNNDAHLVGNLSKSLVGPGRTAVRAVPVLNVTVYGTGSIGSLNVNNVVVSLLVSKLVAYRADLVALIGVGVSCADLNVHEVGKLGELCVSPNLLTLCAVPVLNVTVFGTGSFLSLNVIYLATKSGNNNAESVGKLSKSSIGEYCITVCTVPVLNVTGVVAAGSYSIDVNDLSGVRNGKVLSVGEKSTSYISEYCITLCAVPILVRAVLVARSLNCGNVGKGVKCGNGYVLSVRKLSESSIGKYCITVCTVPVLKVAVLVAACLCSSNVDDLCSVGNSKVLSVGEKSTSCISEYCITLCAVPILVRAVLVARSLNCGNVGKIVKCGSDNTLEVGEHCKSSISEYCVTICTVPVLKVTGLMAACFNCCNVDDLCGVVGDYALSVGKLSKSSIGKYCIAICTVPELNVTGLVAGSLNCSNVDDLCGVVGDYVLSVRKLSESSIGEYSVTVCTVPVLNVTGLVASCLNCCNVDDLCGVGNSKVLSVGENSTCCISKYCIAVLAEPVLSNAVLVAACLNCGNIGKILKCGNGYVLDVGKLGKSIVSPNLLTVCTVPVLNVTGLMAGRISSLNVDYLAANCGKNNAESVGKLSKSSIGEYSVTVCAVPVLNVTGIVAAGSYSVDVNDLSGVKNGKVLSVGENSTCCISKYCIAVLAEPVLSNAVLVAACLNCGNIGKILKCGNGYVLDVGKLGKSIVSPNLLTVCTVPVLNVTGLMAGRISSLNVDYLAANCGKNNAESVGKLSKSSIGEYSITVCAVPVLNVTGVVAAGSYSVDVNDLSSVVDSNTLEVGDLSKSSISKYCVTVCTVPVLNVTGLVTGSLNCVNVNDLGSEGDYKILSVGENSSCCISLYQNFTTLC